MEHVCKLGRRMLTVIKYRSVSWDVTTHSSWYLNSTEVFISPQGDVLVQWINAFLLHVCNFLIMLKVKFSLPVSRVRPLL